MLLGTSYSLITGNLVSSETYGFDVANFNVLFKDNTKISLSGIPTEDEDGIKDGKEFSFTVTNSSDYDVNYRIDIIENSGFNMNKYIHYIYSINDSEYSEVFNLEDNYTIKQNKVLRVNSSDIYKVKMWLSIDADESFMSKKFTASISLTATFNESKYASNVIEKLSELNQDGIKKVGNDYRYGENKSFNYVWFNCDDGFSKGEDYCEKWQIIGAFNNHKENSKEEFLMLKIVNSNPVSEVSFNNEEKSGDYDNSYVESYANGFYYDKLNDNAKKLIMKAKWNIGSVKSNTYEEVLKEEKSKEYYGNIGLINISDYLYSRDELYFDNDSIMLLNKSDDKVNVLNNSIVTGKNLDNYNFLPCLYLRPDVSITSGDGSINNPYELTIKYPLNY